jgi:hypothetical protein
MATSSASDYEVSLFGAVEKESDLLLCLHALSRGSLEPHTWTYIEEKVFSTEVKMEGHPVATRVETRVRRVSRGPQPGAVVSFPETPTTKWHDL